MDNAKKKVLSPVNSTIESADTSGAADEEEEGSATMKGSNFMVSI